MDKVDQFESVFRSADKERFHYQRRDIRSVLVVTDLDRGAAPTVEAEVRGVTSALGDANYVTITGDEFTSPRDLLDVVERQRPDLIATYRCLHSPAWRWVFSLGAHVDVLTQATSTPVLLLPHPERETGPLSGRTDRVMAVTDHLSGEQALVNAALALVDPGGTLYLSHVEDDAVFKRFMDVIGRVPEIDTDLARERIGAQLLKEPSDYIRSVTEELTAGQVECSVEQVVTMGHHVNEYRTLVEEKRVDLLVMNTKDEDHSAMHGLAYPLAVELRDVPLLML